MVSKLIVVTFLIASLFEGAHFQLAKMGRCPNTKPINDLKVADFAGKWYEVQRYPSSVMMGKCVTIDYKSSDKGSTITTSMIVPGMNTTVEQCAHGFGKSSNYRMTVGMVSANASFSIIDTDYKNYAAIYSCGTFFNFSSVHYGWIYSRARNISQANLDKALAAFKKAEIETSPLMASEQTGC